MYKSLNKRIIAVFDFDGTLTQKDTFIEFIKFTCNPIHYYFGMMLFAPLLVLMKLHLYSNWKTKEHIFSFFFKNWQYADFKERGSLFSDVIKNLTRHDTMQILRTHQERGHCVYIISASVEEWVRPWCEQQGIEHILCTQIEVNKKGRITGRLKSKNCYGQEKVNRLLAEEPERNSYFLYAYGDSNGDKKILSFADKGIKVSHPIGDNTQKENSCLLL